MDRNSIRDRASKLPHPPARAKIRMICPGFAAGVGRLGRGMSARPDRTLRADLAAKSRVGRGYGVGGGATSCEVNRRNGSGSEGFWSGRGPQCSGSAKITAACPGTLALS